MRHDFQLHISADAADCRPMLPRSDCRRRSRRDYLQTDEAFAFGFPAQFHHVSRKRHQLLGSQRRLSFRCRLSFRQDIPPARHRRLRFEPFFSRLPE